MKRLTSILLGIVLIFSGQDNVQAQESIENFSKDEIIVTYHKVAESADETSFLESLGANSKLWKKALGKKHFRKLKKNLGSQGYAILSLDKAQDKAKMKTLISKINGEHFNSAGFELDAAFPNYLYEVNNEDSHYSGISAKPNDELYDQQWHHDVVEPEKLWKYSKGEGIVVAVIDTGVDFNHQDLADNIWTNQGEIPGNGIDDDRNGYIDDVRGWDFVERGGFNCLSSEDCTGEDNNPDDVNGHGTHVAGIIGAVDNNQIGISGIAPNVEIMPLRAGYSTGFSAFLKTSDILDAIIYAINNDADVINMSFAGPELSRLAEILKLAEDIGIVCVAAAGNSGTTRQTYPAALSSVIAVGALSDDKSKASYSNSGSWVDFVAPGSWIFSTTPNNNYDYKSGTSMAAPIVAGLAALIKGKNKLKTLSVAEVKARIQSGLVATNFKENPDSTQTIGGVNAGMSFPLVIDDIDAPSSILLGDTASLSVKASDSNSTVTGFEWSSDLDGFIGNNEEISTNSLSLGSHVITARVRNASGEWSEPAFKIVNVTETRNLNTQNFAEDFKFRMKRRRKRLFAGLSKKTKKQVQAIKWISSVDGTISEKRGLKLRDLSRGYHKISLVLQDQDGNWSDPIQRVIQN